MANRNNDSTQYVQKLQPGGISTIFATFTNNVDVSGLTIDASDNVYVAETDTGRVDKFTPAGVESLYATLEFGITDLAFDAKGNLFVANASDNTVSEVTPFGAITTFASGLQGADGLAFLPAGVPERATWPGGLGLCATAGLALRRRRA